MRSKSLLIAAMLQAIAFGDPAGAAPVLSGRIYSEWYSAEPRISVDSTIDVSRAFLGTQVFASDLVTGSSVSVDGFLSVRAAQSLASRATFDPDWRPFQAYLHLRSERLGWLRLGRLFVRGGVGARTADGVRAILTIDDIPGNPMIGPILQDEVLLTADEVGVT